MPILSKYPWTSCFPKFTRRILINVQIHRELVSSLRAIQLFSHFDHNHEFLLYDQYQTTNCHSFERRFHIRQPCKGISFRSTNRNFLNPRTQSYSSDCTSYRRSLVPRTFWNFLIYQDSSGFNQNFILRIFCEDT